MKILALVIVLSALLSAFSLPHAEEYSVPTLYINNRAWHMSALFPLTEQNGAYLVPSAFFGAVDGVEISEDEERQCILIQYGDKYVSISLRTSNALLPTGEVRKTTVSLIIDEYFVDSALCAEALGFDVEITKLYEKVFLRIKTEKDLLDFQTLIERNRISESALPNSTENEVTTNRQEKNLSLVADFTKMSVDEQTAFCDFLTDKGISATVIVQKKNLTDTELLQGIIRANALGCSFIIHATNTAAVSECNELLATLIRNRTRLALATGGLKAPLDAIGYIPVSETSVKVSANPNNFEFTTLSTVEISNFTNQTKANTEKWIAAAEANSVCIKALNCRTGN